MERKRRGYRELEGRGGTVPLPFVTPRKRSASLSCQGGTKGEGHDAGAKRASVLGDVHTLVESFVERVKESGPAMAATTATAMMGVEEPVRWRGNRVAAPAADLTLKSQDGDEDSNSAMGGLLGEEAWSLEQNLPKEVFLPTLLRAYDIIHAKYSRSKARKLDIEVQFEEQRRSHERFQQVADGYIQDLCSENQELRKALDAAEKRMKWLESLYLNTQKDGMRACERSGEKLLQRVDREADVAASPARPLTPTTNKLAAEVEPAHLEVQLPSEQVRPPRTVEVAECRVENTVHQDNIWNQGIEVTQGIEGPKEIMPTQGNDMPQVLTQDNEGPRENMLNPEGNVEPSRSGEEHFVSTQKSIGEIVATNQGPQSPVAMPLLENSLDNARCFEDGAPAELDKAIVTCLDPVVDSLPHSNEAQLQDLHRREVELRELHHHLVELQELHRKEVDLQDLHRKEIELKEVDLHRKEVALQNLHRKEVELQDRHRKEVAGLLSELEMLHKILSHFIDMSVVSDETARVLKGIPTLILSHPLTGFRFRLEIAKAQEEVGKDLELSYRNLSLGTLVRVAPWWMKEELVFTVDQLVNFMRKFQETVTGCKY